MAKRRNKFPGNAICQIDANNWSWWLLTVIYPQTFHWSYHHSGRWFFVVNFVLLSYSLGMKKRTNSSRQEREYPKSRLAVLVVPWMGALSQIKTVQLNATKNCHSSWLNQRLTVHRAHFKWWSSEIFLIDETSYVLRPKSNSKKKQRIMESIIDPTTQLVKANIIQFCLWGEL